MIIQSRSISAGDPTFSIILTTSQQEASKGKNFINSTTVEGFKSASYLSFTSPQAYRDSVEVRRCWSPNTPGY